MNTTSHQPQLRQSPYRLSEGLRDESVMLGAHPAVLCDGDHDDLLFSKLGHVGWGRLHHFHRYYSAGWGDGSGKPLSPRAMETLSRFLETMEFPANMRPSVFLTRDGFIELSWEDVSGKAVQAEFRSKDIEIYIEAQGIEESVPSNRVQEIAERLRAI